MTRVYGHFYSFFNNSSRQSLDFLSICPDTIIRNKNSLCQDGNPNKDLNTTNNRGQLCLTQILAFHAHFFHNSFHILSIKFQHNLFLLHQLYTELNDNLNFSLTGYGYSLSECIYALDCHVDSPIFTSELSQRKVNMQTYDYNSVSESKSFTQIHSDSRQFSKTHANNAKLARHFIKTHKLSRENFKFHPAYCDLAASKFKRAIYDQLRIQSQKKAYRVKNRGICSSITRVKRSHSKQNIGKGRLVLESLKLFTALLIEKLILSRSFLFFSGLNFSVNDSWLAALIIELCYMITSSASGKASKTLNILIYLYSAFTICFYAYVNDAGIENFKKAQQLKIQTIKTELSRAKKELVNITIEKEDILNASNRYIELGAITRGVRELKGRGTEIRSLEGQIRAKIITLEASLLKNQTSKLNQSTFSIANLQRLNFKTYSLMGMFLLIQLLSSYFLNSFFKTLSQYLKQKSKLKNTRLSNQRRTLKLC